MERVTGVGGVFFRAADPAGLASWYATHLGVDPAPESYDVPSWWQEAGPTVFTAMPSDSDHFGDARHSWAVNFRVGDLAAIVDQLRRAGVDVDVDPETHPNGTFASLHDPEGNPVQLWQPAGADLRDPT
jgi:glyoxylase I family protein